jgi:hypothetical protein
VILELGHCPNKAGNVVVDARLETRTSKIVDHRLNLTRRHIAGRPEDATEDKGEVYNVAHHKTDLLLAKERVEANYVKSNGLKGKLTYSRNDWSATQLPSSMCHLT